jgi:8-oxo-dGTP pyrophosphatase MutT (NUDIX family)
MKKYLKKHPYMEPDGLQEDKEEKRVSKVIIFDDDKILILKRTDGDKDWDLPGGHVEKNETFQQGARRETKEETGLEISKLTFLKKDKRIKFYTTSYPKTKIILQDEEHTDYKWIKPAQIEDYQTKDILKDAILDAIKSRDKKKLKKEHTEPYQRKVRKGHRKMKIRLIGKGGQSNSAPYTKKPSTKRSKSAPPAG